jgi:hypothetical protein
MTTAVKHCEGSSYYLRIARVTPIYGTPFTTLHTVIGNRSSRAGFGLAQSARGPPTQATCGSNCLRLEILCNSKEISQCRTVTQPAKAMTRRMKS